MNPICSPSAVWVVLSVLTAASVDGQWINYPSPGIARTSDGKPDLAAAAPRTPDGKSDLSGVWRLSSRGYSVNVAADLKPEDIQPWAVALHAQRKLEYSREHMSVRCLPRGPAATIATPDGPMRIIQTPFLLTILYEDLSYRLIFLDGRPLPTDPNPTWMGYSIGHWDGDTLVVESVGFTDRSWLDFEGHPHTDALKISERFRRVNVGRVDVEVTLSDPSVYSRPIIVKPEMTLMPDTDLLEYVCNENEKDRTHMIGKTTDNRTVNLSPAVLSRYAGRFVLNQSQMQIDLVDGKLVARLNQNASITLEALSETQFLYREAPVDFQPDGASFRIRANGVESTFTREPRP